MDPLIPEHDNAIIEKGKSKVQLQAGREKRDLSSGGARPQAGSHTSQIDNHSFSAYHMFPFSIYTAYFAPIYIIQISETVLQFFVYQHPHNLLLSKKTATAGVLPHKKKTHVYCIEAT